MSAERVAVERSRGIAELTVFAPPALLLLFAFGYLTRNGAGSRDLAIMTVVVLVTQVLPGMVLWRCIRPRQGWWIEDVVMGAALGAALVVPTQLMSVVLEQSWLVWVLPLAWGGALLAWPRTRSRFGQARCSPLPRAWGGLCALASVIPVWAALRFVDQQAVNWKGWASPYVDLPYHLALSGELANRFPPDYPQVAGESLHYHFFAHAWIAQVGTASGAPLEIVLFRFMPAVIAVLVPLATAVVALRITKLPWAAPLAAAIAFSFTELSLFNTDIAALPINPYSPTQGFGVLLLLAVVSLLSMHWRSTLGVAGVVILVVVTFLAGGSKGSTLPVLLCGCVVAVVAAAFARRAVLRRVVADTAMVAVILVIIVKLIFGGADGGLRVDLFGAIVELRGAELATTPETTSGFGSVSVVVITLLAVVLGSIGAVGVLTDRDSRTDPVAWLLAGGGMAGVGAIVVFSHPGQSQWYFLWTGEVMLAIVAAWGSMLLLRGVPKVLSRIALGGLVGIVGAIAARAVFNEVASDGVSIAKGWLAWGVFAVIVVLGSWAIGRAAGVRAVVAAGLAAVTVAGIVPAVVVMTSAMPPASNDADAGTVGAFHSSQVSAARWIRDHSDPDDIVMSNRHCRASKDKPECDVRRFFVAAYSERRVLVEGWAYTKQANASADVSPLGNVRRAPFWDPELLELNDSFFTEPTADKADQLRELGVRWVFVDDTGPHAESLEPYAVERYRTKHATIYELIP